MMQSLSSGSIASSDLPIADPIIFGEGFGGISNLVVGPDGYLYVVSIGTGDIYKISQLILLIQQLLPLTPYSPA